MLELRLASIHDDGEKLVLESADGTSYLLPIDQNLRTSIAKARRIQPSRGRPGAGAFGPRDIQTRFRQGASVEEIAAESGWDAERVRRYEWPIIAERSHTVAAAKNVRISSIDSRNKAGERTLSLNEHIEQVSAEYGFSEAEQAWSAWQQESGQWTVSVDIRLDDAVQQKLPRNVLFPARWSYNPANQSIYASNESAYFLQGKVQKADSPLPGIGHHEPAGSVAQTQELSDGAQTSESVPAQSHLTSVRVPHNPAQDAVLDELDSRRGTRDHNSASERKLADLLERARQSAQSTSAGVAADTPAVVSPPEDILGGGTEVVAQPTSDRKEADLPVDQAKPEPVSLEIHEEPTASSAALDTEPDVADPESIEEDGQETPVSSSPVDHDAKNAEAEQAPIQENQDQPAAPRAKPKRASVPSWDDIIFGNQRK